MVPQPNAAIIAESSLVRQLVSAIWAGGVQKLAALLAEVDVLSILCLATRTNDHGTNLKGDLELCGR
jgi:hypothetical protein